MQFVDEGYIVNLRKYGENSVIVTVVSKNHGLLTGFVKGGMSKKNLGVYQLGNLIRIDAYARIEENMYFFELKKSTTSCGWGWQKPTISCVFFGIVVRGFLPH